MQGRKAGEKFSISYDSDEGDLSQHKINARELGRAIVGVSDLVSEAALILSNGGADVELKVTTPAKKGSIIVDFLLTSTSPEVLTVLKYLGFSALGGAPIGATLIELVAKIKNQTITSVKIDADNKEAEVTVDGKIIRCNAVVAKLVSNKKIRESLHQIIQAPLSNKHNPVFKVIDSEKKDILVIEDGEIDDFTPLPSGSLEDIHVEHQHINISFAQVNFESSKGWKIRFKDGMEKAAILKDEKFLKSVKENQQAFRKDDLYEVKLEITTTSRPTRSTIDYVITEVTNHWVAKEKRLI